VLKEDVGEDGTLGHHVLGLFFGLGVQPVLVQDPCVAERHVDAGVCPVGQYTTKGATADTASSTDNLQDTAMSIDTVCVF
jgi:hypothetical protein